MSGSRPGTRAFGAAEGLSSAPLARWIVLGFFGFLVVARFALSRSTSLFGDEAFYYLCALHPDIAYADHPFVTAMLVRGGIELLGHGTEGVRLLFQAIGASFPFLVYAMAAPVVGRRDAWSAAALSLTLPATAHLGVIAIPDVPLLAFAALSLCFLVRAIKSGALFCWLLAAVATGLGLSTHLRFALVPFSLAVYLLLFRSGRTHLRSAGVWVYGAVASLGFLPVLVYNVRHDWAPLLFQGKERHGFDIEGLLEYVPLQLAAVTPVAFVVLMAVLLQIVRRARSDDACALFSCFALAHIGLFFVLSPVADPSHATIHWPAPGYLPLIVFAPGFLRRYVAARPTRGRRAVALLTPGIGAVALLLALVEMTTGVFGVKALRRPFAGWTEIAAAVEQNLPESPRGRPVVIADHYMLAGNLAQKLHGRIDLFVLHHPKNVEHGRASQFDQWDMGEAAIRRRAGDPALLVLEPRQVSSSIRRQWREHARSFLRDIELIDVVEVHDTDDKRFSLFRGIVRD